MLWLRKDLERAAVDGRSRAPLAYPGQETDELGGRRDVLATGRDRIEVAHLAREPGPSESSLVEDRVDRVDPDGVDTNVRRRVVGCSDHQDPEVGERQLGTI